MPLIQITIDQNSLSSNQQQTLMTQMSQSVSETLAKKLEVTQVQLHTLSTGMILINSQKPQQPAASVTIFITQGTNTPDQKSAMIARAWALLNQHVGPLAEASYVIIQEVPSDGWGYAGQTQQERFTSL